MNPVLAALVVLLVLSVIFAVTWLVAKRIGKWAIVDPIWSFSVGFNAILYALLVKPESPARAIVICLIAGLYSARLGSHLLKRVLSHDKDDPRYLEFAREWGDKANSRMLLFFQFQAAGSLALCVSIFVALNSPNTPFGALDLIGIAWALLSIAGEATADRQLSAFKAESESNSRVCKRGLWRYSRHPNYFFQWMFWLSFIPLSLAAEHWWLSFVSPLLVLHFLLNVTGIPPTEKRAIESKGDAYRAYQKETSAFVPLPPSKNHKH